MSRRKVGFLTGVRIHKATGAVYQITRLGKQLQIHNIVVHIHFSFLKSQFIFAPLA
jgi:hypothetical protein